MVPDAMILDFFILIMSFKLAFSHSSFTHIKWLLSDSSLSAIKEKESESEVAQSCLTPCDPLACSLPGFSVRGIFQARILEWVTISFSRRSSQPRDWTRVSHIVADALPSEPPGKSKEV